MPGYPGKCGPKCLCRNLKEMRNVESKFGWMASRQFRDFVEKAVNCLPGGVFGKNLFLKDSDLENTGSFAPHKFFGENEKFGLSQELDF